MPYQKFPSSIENHISMEVRLKHDSLMQYEWNDDSHRDEWDGREKKLIFLLKKKKKNLENES